MTAAFYCCEKKCMKFEPDAFVQLGYNGAGKALVFIPELAGGAIDMPERGTFVDEANARQPRAAPRSPRASRGAEIDISLPRGIVVH